MKKKPEGKSFESRCDFLETYIDEGIGVINLGDKVFEIAADLALKGAFFEKIHLAHVQPEIELLLILSADSAMGEDKNARFMKTKAESFNGEISLIREENALSQFIQSMCGYEKIVVSCVRGSVVGAFLGTILSTDVRIASENTVFSFPHIRYEMPPWGALAFFLPCYVGMARAKRILLSGVSLSAAEAHELGLVDEVVSDGVFEDKCLEITKKMPRIPPSVVGETKRLMGSDMKGLEACIEMETKMLAGSRIKPC